MALVPCRKMLGTRDQDSGSEPYCGIKSSSMGFQLVAVVVRQYALSNCLWQIVLGCEWGEKRSDHEQWFSLRSLL